MAAEELIEKIKGRLYCIAKGPLKVMPLWVEALGAGIFMAAVTEAKPRLKERLVELDGKRFLFEATDLGRSFNLLFEEGEIKVVPYMTGEADVVMRGEGRILAELLLGQVDADTVFFSRKLEVNGATDTAILFKNILADM